MTRPTLTDPVAIVRESMRGMDSATFDVLWQAVEGERIRRAICGGPDAREAACVCSNPTCDHPDCAQFEPVDEPHDGG